MTTIAWRLAHLIVGFAEMNGTHFGGPSVNIATFDYAGTAREALGQLDDVHDRWIDGVRGLGAAGLVQAQGATQPPEFAYAPWRDSFCPQTWRSSTTERRSACSVTSTCETLLSGSDAVRALVSLETDS